MSKYYAIPSPAIMISNIIYNLPYIAVFGDGSEGHLAVSLHCNALGSQPSDGNAVAMFVEQIVFLWIAKI